MNATIRHSVAFECANDAKKNDPNVYFHMEPGENLVHGVNPLLSYFWTIFVSKDLQAKRVPNDQTLS